MACAVVCLQYVQFVVANLVAPRRTCLASLGRDGPDGRAIVGPKGRAHNWSKGKLFGLPGHHPRRQQARSDRVYGIIYDAQMSGSHLSSAPMFEQDYLLQVDS